MTTMVRPPYSSGFTVIEVMLFLAISGLMILGMLTGISGGINRQRYDDAVHSLQDYMQGQYNLVDNVRNNRGASSIAGCDGSSRGTSDCTVVGRVITTNDGRSFTSEPVIATSSTLDTMHGEAALLDSLGLTPSPSGMATDVDDYLMAWSTQIYTDPSAKGTSNTVRILIVRMPTSGVIRTYFQTTITTNLSDIWNAGASPAQLTLCVEPDGLVASPPTGTRILRDAVNANSVQFITAGAGVC